MVHDFGTNAEMRWDSVAGQGYTTPNERFFVRNHTATPLIDAGDLAAARLRQRPARSPERDRALSYHDLRQLPRPRSTAFDRVRRQRPQLLRQPAGHARAGTQWKLGAIGVARWRGVRSAEVLERAGISARGRRPARGLDATVVTGGVDYGHVRRPLPVAKALDDVLLAYEMNGEPLPPDHGFPLRLVVPGWVGIANIKWVGQIEVSDQPLFSPWNTT